MKFLSIIGKYYLLSYFFNEGSEFCKVRLIVYEDKINGFLIIPSAHLKFTIILQDRRVKIKNWKFSEVMNLYYIASDMNGLFILRKKSLNNSSSKITL